MHYYDNTGLIDVGYIGRHLSNTRLTNNSMTYAIVAICLDSTAPSRVPPS